MQGERYSRSMRRYLKDWVFATGLILLVVGSGPLIGIIVLARIGVWPDPDPNPIGPGLLSFLTLWPAVILMIMGAKRISRRG